MNITRAKIFVKTSTIYAFIESINGQPPLRYKELSLLVFSENDGHEIYRVQLKKDLPISVDFEDVEYLTADNSFLILYGNNSLWKFSYSDRSIIARQKLPSEEYNYFKDLLISDKGIYVLRPEKEGITLVKLDENLNLQGEYYIKVTDIEDSTVVLATRNSIFYDGEYLYIFLSVGKINEHIWAGYIKLREQINVQYFVIVGLLGVATVVSAFTLIVNLRKIKESQ